MNNIDTQMDIITQYGYKHHKFARHNFCYDITEKINKGDELSCDQLFKINKICSFVLNNCMIQRHEPHQDWVYIPERRSYTPSRVKSSRKNCVKKQVIKPSQQHRITSYFIKKPEDMKCADLLSDYEKTLKPVSINDFFAKK